LLPSGREVLGKLSLLLDLAKRRVDILSAVENPQNLWDATTADLIEDDE
jgi:hypothetical protein